MFKRIALLLILGIFSFSSLADGKPFAGQINETELLDQYPKFATEYKRFKPSKTDLKMMQALAGKTLLVLFGPWCHDSQREVPRLLKLLDESHVKLEKLRLVALDYNKQDPDGIAAQYELLYTPTFIVLDDDKELYRLVEKPKNSIASDLSEFK